MKTPAMTRTIKFGLDNPVEMTIRQAVDLMMAAIKNRNLDCK
jgi:hypothetical protein